MPYDRELVSLPGLGTSPFPCEESLRPEHRDLIVGDCASMLNSPDETVAALQCEGVKHHVDPAFRSPHVYASFLSLLHDRGVITWERDLPSTCGLFFVSKKDGRLRLILDTRVANCHFRAPPRVSLPTGGALGSLECLPGEQLYFAGGDIDNCFYRIAAPAAARHLVIPPGIYAKHSGSIVSKCEPVDPGSWVVPQFAVLPVGWSWALWVAQSIHENMAEATSMPRECRTHDCQVVAPLGRVDTRHAIYVDNFLVAGRCLTQFDKQASALGNRLNDADLVVHEVFSATTHATFAGVDYDGERLTARVSSRRIWRLRYAIDYVLGRHDISGRSLEKILGHFTWGALVRREALAVVCACYEFVRKCYDSCTRIWSSVRRELRWMRSLLPLFGSRYVSTLAADHRCL